MFYDLEEPYYQRHQRHMHQHKCSLFQHLFHALLFLFERQLSRLRLEASLYFHQIQDLQRASDILADDELFLQ